MESECATADGSKKRVAYCAAIHTKSLDRSILEPGGTERSQLEAMAERCPETSTPPSRSPRTGPRMRPIPKSPNHSRLVDRDPDCETSTLHLGNLCTSVSVQV